MVMIAPTGIRRHVSAGVFCANAVIKSSVGVAFEMMPPGYAIGFIILLHVTIPPSGDSVLDIVTCTWTRNGSVDMAVPTQDTLQRGNRFHACTAI